MLGSLFAVNCQEYFASFYLCRGIESHDSMEPLHRCCCSLEPTQLILLFATAILGLLVLAFFVFFARYFSLWLQAYMSNANVSI